MANLLEQYFLNPILDRTGYNAANTAVYAAIALAAAYAIYRLFGKLKIKIDERFVIYTLPFVLLGSTLRVVTDSIDTGAMASLASPASSSLFSPLYRAILASHIYDYSFLTTTPGIYILVGILTLLCAILAFHFLARPKLYPAIGLALLLPHLLLLLTMSQYWFYFFLALALAAVPTALACKFLFSGSPLATLTVLAHSLDGAATFIVIDVFSAAVGKQYFEQHVVSNLIGSTQLGFFLFFLIKAAFSTAAAYIIVRDKAPSSEKNYIFLLLIIFGLAPGARDVLRMLVGA